MASTIPLLRRDADSITNVLPGLGLDVAVLEDDEGACGDDRRVCGKDEYRLGVAGGARPAVH